MIRISDRTERILEFLVVGLVMGISEDLLAVWLTTGESITWSVFGMVFAIALPFAFLSEFVVDHPRFWQNALGLKVKQAGESASPASASTANASDDSSARDPD